MGWTLFRGEVKGSAGERTGQRRASGSNLAFFFPVYEQISSGLNFAYDILQNKSPSVSQSALLKVVLVVICHHLSLLLAMSPEPFLSTLLIFLLIAFVFSLKGTMGDKTGSLFYPSIVPQGFTCALPSWYPVAGTSLNPPYFPD